MPDTNDVQVSQAIEAGSMTLFSSTIDAPMSVDKAWEDIGPELRNRWRRMFEGALNASLETGLEIRRRQPNEKPIHTAIKDWLEAVVAHSKRVRAEESVISRRQCLKIIYQFAENAERALLQNAQANPN